MSTVVKAVLIGAGVLLVLVLVLGGIGLYLLTRSTDMQAEIRAVNSDSTATRSFEQKLTILEKEIKQASAAGEKRQVELILTEEEVSATLGEMMGEAIAETSDDISGGMVVDAIVNLDDDSIRAVVGLEVQGVKVNAGVKLQANADDEGLNLELEHIEIGKLPFFGPIETMIVNRFNEAHTDIDFGDLHIDLEAGLPVELCDLIVRDGEMIIIGTTT